MISYTTLGSNDLPRAGAFYDALLGVMGAQRFFDMEGGIGWGTAPDKPMFCVMKPFDGQAATVGNGVMIALSGAVTYGFLTPNGPLPIGSVGFVNVPVALLIALASILSAPIGARWAHRLPGTRLKQIFAGFLLLVAAILFKHAL